MGEFSEAYETENVGVDAEMGKVEGSDADFGDGDGINDFDDSSYDMDGVEGEVDAGLDSDSIENDFDSSDFDGVDTAQEADIDDSPIYYDNVSYEQGQNDLGYLGTCGPTSAANALNRVTGRNDYTENDVLKVACENKLCYEGESREESGGTNTEKMVELIDKAKKPEDDIECKVLEYGDAPDVDELADEIDSPNKVAIVGVDSSTLWNERPEENAGVFNTGLFKHREYSDHWVTVDSARYDESGEIKGFNIIDSGGQVAYADKEKFAKMYKGSETFEVKDPTAIIVENKGEVASEFDNKDFA